jgi:energy-coupling factor transporter transmembrane protein EcfT
MQQMGRPGGFFFLFGILRFLPYIAISLLVIAIAIWIVFGIKKFRWAKILAIVLTVFVVLFGSLSIFTIFLGRNMPQNRMGPQDGGNRQDFQPPDDQNFNNGQPQDNIQTNLLFYNFKAGNEILIKI